MTELWQLQSLLLLWLLLQKVFVVDVCDCCWMRRMMSVTKREERLAVESGKERERERYENLSGCTTSTCNDGLSVPRGQSGRGGR